MNAGFVVGILILIIGVLAAIGLHELGHLLPAKRFGVKVPQYFVGFGPTIFSRKRGETEYGLKLIPLGGYVRLAGMHPAKASPANPDSMVEQARAESRSDLLPGEEHRDFASLTVPRKLMVMFGGPLTNWLLALLLLLVVTAGIGLGTATNKVDVISECVPAVGVTGCGPEATPSPALAAGIEPGDRLISINDAAVGSWDEVTAAISTSPFAPIPVVIERDGAPRTLTLTPAQRDDGAGNMVPFIGISPAYELVRQSPAVAVATWWQFTGMTFEAVVSIPQQIWDTTAGLFNPSDAGAPDRSVVSLVGVGSLAGSIGSNGSSDYTIAMRAVDMLMLLASLNIALFAFNMIPLPPLDGGHIAGALVEGARKGIAKLAGRPNPGPVDTAKLLPLAYLVMGLLLVMTVVLVWADIQNPIL